MLPYGMSKLFDLQFQLPASVYAKPLGEIPGTSLTWAFLGYSPVFQILLGAFETVPAILLMFSRTRRLGALLLFPVAANVVMFNFFLDLWPGTQMISSVLLGLNVFLLLYDLPLYLGFLSRLMERPEPVVGGRLRTAGKVVAFLVPAVVIGLFLKDFRGQLEMVLFPYTDFIGERQINRSGTWSVESVRIGDVPVSQGTGAILYFDFNQRCILESGSIKETGKYQVDKSKHTFQISGVPVAGNRDQVQGTYRVEGEKLLLDGYSEGRPVAVVLRRYRWGHTGH